MSDTLAVGSTIWRLDENYRIYRGVRGLEYRSFWSPATITGETARHWIIGKRSKCPKRGEHLGWALTWDEVEADVWAHDMRPHIVRRVAECDVATLRAVARVVGFAEGGPS